MAKRGRKPIPEHGAVLRHIEALRFDEMVDREIEEMRSEGPLPRNKRQVAEERIAKRLRETDRPGRPRRQSRNALDRYIDRKKKRSPDGVIYEISEADLPPPQPTAKGSIRPMTEEEAAEWREWWLRKMGYK